MTSWQGNEAPGANVIFGLIRVLTGASLSCHARHPPATREPLTPGEILYTEIPYFPLEKTARYTRLPRPAAIKQVQQRSTATRLWLGRLAMTLIDASPALIPGIDHSASSLHPGGLAALAAFWPHCSAQRCGLLLISEQSFGRSTVRWAGTGPICRSLRIKWSRATRDDRLYQVWSQIGRVDYKMGRPRAVPDRPGDKPRR